MKYALVAMATILVVACSSNDSIEIIETETLEIPEDFTKLETNELFVVPQGEKALTEEITPPPATVGNTERRLSGTAKGSKELNKDGNGITHLYTDQPFEVVWESLLEAINASNLEVLDLNRTKRLIYLNLDQDGNRISKPGRAEKEALRLYVLDTGRLTDIAVQKNETELASNKVSEKILTQLEPLLNL